MRVVGRTANQKRSPQPRKSASARFSEPVQPGDADQLLRSDRGGCEDLDLRCRGRLIERLVNERQTAGDHTVEWHASKEWSGIYFCRFEADGVVDTRKLILLK